MKASSWPLSFKSRFLLYICSRSNELTRNCGPYAWHNEQCFAYGLNDTSDHDAVLETAAQSESRDQGDLLQCQSIFLAEEKQQRSSAGYCNIRLPVDMAEAWLSRLFSSGEEKQTQCRVWRSRSLFEAAE